MSDMKNFDDIFKHTFSDYSPEVPEQIWDNIAAAKKKKRAAGFWFNTKNTLLTATALLLIAGAYFLFNHNNITEVNTNVRKKSSQNNQSTAAADVQNVKSSTSANGVSKENEETATTADATSLQNKTGSSPNNRSRTNSKLTANNLAGADDNNALAYLPDAKTNRLNTGRRFGKLTNHTEKPDAVSAEDNNVNDEAIELKIDSTTIGFLLPVNRELFLVPKHDFSTKQTIQTILNKAIHPSEDCPGAGAGNKYYIEAYISPDYAIKKYSDTGISTLVAKRKESLHIQSAFSAGARYTRVFANGMSIRAGLNYSQVNEKFSYLQDNVVQQVFVINPQGDTTDRYFVRGTRYRNSYNRYRTFDVPVVIGYEMGNDNFHVNINAGAVINIYSWQTGETIDDHGLPIDISTGKADNPYHYKTNAGIGFTAAASVYYKLNDRLHVLAEPYLRYNLSPMNKEAVSIQEKFTTIGIRLGVRMDLK